MKSHIDQVAEHLLREGHFDCEVDARLAAVHILLAASLLSDNRERNTGTSSRTESADRAN